MKKTFIFATLLFMTNQVMGAEVNTSKENLRISAQASSLGPVGLVPSFPLPSLCHLYPVFCGSDNSSNLLK
ncbi:MAG: hypothetical protein HRU19_30385 [Pseudobacteriovorax sp.]|nr:hypothetical protein [Pseudobacteriovorax sp.]